MIRELVARLRTRAKENAAARVAMNGAAIRKYVPIKKLRAGTSRLIVSTGTGNALNAGKRYRLTSDHAPIFSLYTFFGNR